MIAALILSCSGANWPSTMMMPALPTATVMFPPLALEHVDVVAEVGGLDLDLGEIDRRGRCRRRGRGLLLCECAAGQQQGYGNRRTSNPNHRKSPQSP